MELLAVSKETLRAHVIRYFNDVFGTPTSEFKPKPTSARPIAIPTEPWSQLANVFNKLSWRPGQCRPEVSY